MGRVRVRAVEMSCGGRSKRLNRSRHALDSKLARVVGGQMGRAGSKIGGTGSTEYKMSQRSAV